MIKYSLLFKLLGGVFVVLPLFYTTINHIVEAKYLEVDARITGIERLEAERMNGLSDGVDSIERRLARIEDILLKNFGK